MSATDIDLDTVDVATTDAPPARTATDKQRAYINSLLRERDTTGTPYEGWMPDWSRSTPAAASQVITALNALPRGRRQVTNTEAITAGVYRSPAGTVIRVYLGQQSGRMLAKQVWTNAGTVSYDYLGTAATHLPPGSKRLSVEEVGELGKACDHCVVCGRRLDDPESVDRGLGPVCAKNYA